MNTQPVSVSDVCIEPGKKTCFAFFLFALLKSGILRHRATGRKLTQLDLEAILSGFGIDVDISNLIHSKKSYLKQLDQQQSHFVRNLFADVEEYLY